MSYRNREISQVDTDKKAYLSSQSITFAYTQVTN